MVVLADEAGAAPPVFEPGPDPSRPGPPVIRRLTTAGASKEVLTQIRALLDDAFDGELSEEDWQHTVGGWHVVVEEDGVVVAHAAVVPRDLHLGERPVQAGYVEGVATTPARRGRGLGSKAVLEVNEIVRERFELGALSTGLAGFYGRLGWEVWRGPTFVRVGSRLVRTADEDGGVMVLRFGPTAEVDLDLAISCESRPGDDW